MRRERARQREGERMGMVVQALQEREGRRERWGTYNKNLGVHMTVV